MKLALTPIGLTNAEKENIAPEISIIKWGEWNQTPLLEYAALFFVIGSSNRYPATFTFENIRKTKDLGITTGLIILPTANLNTLRSIIPPQIQIVDGGSATNRIWGLTCWNESFADSNSLSARFTFKLIEDEYKSRCLPILSTTTKDALLTFETPENILITLGTIAETYRSLIKYTEISTEQSKSPKNCLFREDILGESEGDKIYFGTSSALKNNRFADRRKKTHLIRCPSLVALALIALITSICATTLPSILRGNQIKANKIKIGRIDREKEIKRDFSEILEDLQALSDKSATLQWSEAEWDAFRIKTIETGTWTAYSKALSITTQTGNLNLERKIFIAASNSDLTEIIEGINDYTFYQNWTSALNSFRKRDFDKAKHRAETMSIWWSSKKCNWVNKDFQQKISCSKKLLALLRLPGAGNLHQAEIDSIANHLESDSRLATYHKLPEDCIPLFKYIGISESLTAKKSGETEYSDEWVKYTHDFPNSPLSAEAHFNDIMIWSKQYISRKSTAQAPDWNEIDKSLADFITKHGSSHYLIDDIHFTLMLVAATSSDKQRTAIQLEKLMSLGPNDGLDRAIDRILGPKTGTKDASNLVKSLVTRALFLFEEQKSASLNLEQIHQKFPELTTLAPQIPSLQPVSAHTIQSMLSEILIQKIDQNRTSEGL